MGDTDTSAAVLDADTASARGFELAGLRHYRLADLDVDGADIHVRRDDQGMGVMALYFEDDANDAGGGDTAASDSAPSTYTIDHLSLKAPAIGFTDVAVAPTVALSGSNLELSVNDLDTASPERDASYRLALDVGEYGHLDSRGTIAPLADGGMNMDLNAWIRSLALAPLSGYLNAAMGRRIARGVADGTLDLQATSGQLDGNLDTTLSNFRLVDEPNNETDIVFGISMDTALGLVRRRDDTIQFETSILGDVTNPYFSVRNLVREAVLAGLRTTIMSDYSPLGLLNKAKNALLDLGRSLVSKPVVFVAGKHYIRPEDRSYLINIAQSMREKPGLRLTIQGHATPQDADALSLLGGATIDSGNEGTLRQLARQRAAAVRDYLAARDVNPDHLTLAEPVIDREADARPEATFSLTGK
jgi:outer membrane protein OmpA-like peptidoglycan-associated protein